MSRDDTVAARGWRGDPYAVRWIQLTALWAYGVAQPIFSFVDGNPELLALRRASQPEVIAFAVCLAFGPPLVVAAYTWAASRVSRWVGDMLFLAFLAVFSVPLALQVVRIVESPTARVGLLGAAALVAVAVGAYTRWRAVRLFLAFSLVLPVVAFGAFVRASPVWANAEVAPHIDVARPAPVVFVVLDEFPLSSLLTSPGRIDAVRYPNFARLARDGTWYPNASTVAEGTTDAVPAILTGQMSRAGDLPVLADHPQNLFSLLDGTYTLDVHETVTTLCPPSACPRDGSAMHRIGSLLTTIGSLYVETSLAFWSSDGTWNAFRTAFREGAASRTDDFDAFLTGLQKTRETSSLHFAHMLLPHVPYEYLPSGRIYRPASLEGLEDEKWVSNRWLVLQAYQQHLLQVGYTDALIGRLLRQLDRAGLYRRSLVVVVADHGVSFRAGDLRRPVTESNLGDIASVPLFVKYPYQSHGSTDVRPARTVDIVPTVADVLGIRAPWHMDGASLVGPPPSRTRVIVAGGDGTALRSSIATMRRQAHATVLRKESNFGEGSDSLYRIGLHRGLVGTSVAVATPASRGVRVRIDDETQFADVRASDAVVPVRISGVVAAGRVAPRVELAVAVNGRIAALTRCFRVHDQQRFRAMVPESALRDGQNQVEILEIEAHEGKTQLVRLGGTSPSPSRS